MCVYVCVCLCVSTCMQVWGVGVEGTLPQGIRHPQETLIWKFQSCSTLPPRPSLMTLRSSHDSTWCVSQSAGRSSGKEPERQRKAELHSCFRKTGSYTVKELSHLKFSFKPQSYEGLLNIPCKEINKLYQRNVFLVQLRTTIGVCRKK